MNPEPVAALDAAFLAVETPTMPLHVMAVAILEAGDGSPGITGIARLVGRRLADMPRMRSRALRVPFGLDHPVWVDVPDFDLERHVRRASLPPPGGPSELQAFLGDVAGSPLDPAHPLWQLTVVEGLESGHLALVAKVHHCLFDGVSGIAALAGIFDPQPDGAGGPGAASTGTRTGAQIGRSGDVPGEPWAGQGSAAGDGVGGLGAGEEPPSAGDGVGGPCLGEEPPPSAGGHRPGPGADLSNVLASVARRWSRRPAVLADTVAGTYLAIRRLWAEQAAAGTGEDEGSERRAGGRPGQQRPARGGVPAGSGNAGVPADAGVPVDAATTALPAEPADGGAPLPFRAQRAPWNGAISAARRCALVEIPLEDLRAIRTALGGTVNDVLLAAVGGALRQLLAARGRTVDVDLVAVAPVSAHPSGPAVAGNRVSAMFVSLGTGVDDPVERLAAVRAGSIRAKRRTAAVSEQLVRGWSELAVPAVLTRLARVAANFRIFDRVPPAANVMVSNVAGPTAPLYLGGARVVAVFPFGPVADGIGLNISVLSYAGTVYAGISGCRDLVPDLDDIASEDVDAVAELAKCAGVPGAHRAAAAFGAHAGIGPRPSGG